MGPRKDSPKPRTDQPGKKRRRLSRRPRRRECLLKDCGRLFRPRHPNKRYCSDACVREARRWSKWKGRKKYRGTAKGKEHRQMQCRRYRKQKRERGAKSSFSKLGEGDQLKIYLIFCDRPGCYEGWCARGRSRVRRYCSKPCRQALERVRDRERKWSARSRR